MRPSLKVAIPTLLAILSIGLLVVAKFAYRIRSSADRYVPRPRGQLTFNRDIAPILHRNCAPCHRPGQPAPFTLSNYADARKHANDIVSVTQKRYMPPWLPERGYGEFVGERRLSAEEMGMIQQWVREGAIEGDPANLPPAPQWTEGWRLGDPDLVLTLPEPYLLDAEGNDVYRNFVVPIPVDSARYVRAFEFHPGNRSVHHVRLLLDNTQQCRRLEAQEQKPGFAGMNVPARFPPGHMLTWTPGRVPSAEPDGLAWALETNTDLVVQLHLQRTGKPELLRPTIGFYFTGQPPAKNPFLLGVVCQSIDIPPGAKAYTIERSFELPASVTTLAVLPHAHYLAKELRAFATLPDGTRKWLIFIPHWDFNWQEEYRCADPVFLPKGSTVTMRYSYDNSADNPRNPHRPPRRVTFGPQSIDEMGELWLQVLAENTNDLALLARDYKLWGLRETAAYFENRLRTRPDDAAAHVGLAKALGPLGQEVEAFEHFQLAASLDPDLVEPHYYLGMILANQRRWKEARTEFEQALRLNPEHARAHTGVGVVMLQQGDLDQAARHLQSALRLNPGDALARDKLQEVSRRLEQSP